MTMYSGKYQSSKAGFMLSSVSKGRSSYQIFLEGASRALEKGVEPCARLDCNLLCTKYTLRLSDEMVRALASGTAVRDYEDEIPAGILEDMSRLEVGAGYVGEQDGEGACQERDGGHDQRYGQGDIVDRAEIQASSNTNNTTNDTNASVALKLHYKARIRGIMQPRRMEVCPTDGDKLFNKPPHWNTGLNCWCLNFHGRVKLASVKNFQLVQEGVGLGMDDPISMQFGKVEEDVFVLDFNPSILSPIQAFGVALSTFNGRIV